MSQGLLQWKYPDSTDNILFKIHINIVTTINRVNRFKKVSKTIGYSRAIINNGPHDKYTLAIQEVFIELMKFQKLLTLYEIAFSELCT